MGKSSMRLFNAIMLCNFAVAVFGWNADAYDIPSNEEIEQGTVFSIQEGCRRIAEHENDVRHMNDDAYRQYLMCFGAVIAVQQLLRAHDEFCPTADFYKDHGAAIINSYIKQHPERTHQQYAVIIADALKATWPCSEKKE